jgi:hypothetical protein
MKDDVGWTYSRHGSDVKSRLHIWKVISEEITLSTKAYQR